MLPERDGVVMVNFFSGFVVPEAATSSDAQLRPSRRRGATGNERGDDAKAQDEADAKAQAERRQRQRRNIPRGTIQVVLDHIDHIAKTAGVAHVGIGSDFDGVSVVPEQLDDVSCYPYITQGLLDRGYTPEQIRGILGENLMRVFAGAEAASKRLAETK
jgi:membrane dipeptidase